MKNKHYDVSQKKQALSKYQSNFFENAKEVISAKTTSFFSSFSGMYSFSLIKTYEQGFRRSYSTSGGESVDARGGATRRFTSRRGDDTGDRLPKEENYGIAHIQSSLSNTIISITDRLGNVLTWSSAGTSGFKGSRRSIQYAAQLTGENVARKSVQLGFKVVEARIQGIGFGKDSALRGLQIGGLKIMKLCDITSIPHNGCRAPKKRRT